MLSPDKFDLIVPRQSYRAKRDDLLDTINKAMTEFDIATRVLRVSMFLAQVL